MANSTNGTSAATKLAKAGFNTNALGQPRPREDEARLAARQAQSNLAADLAASGNVITRPPRANGIALPEFARTPDLATRILAPEEIAQLNLFGGRNMRTAPLSAVMYMQLGTPATNGQDFVGIYTTDANGTLCTGPIRVSFAAAYELSRPPEGTSWDAHHADQPVAWNARSQRIVVGRDGMQRAIGRGHSFLMSVNGRDLAGVEFGLGQHRFYMSEADFVMLCDPMRAGSDPYQQVQAVLGGQLPDTMATARWLAAWCVFARITGQTSARSVDRSNLKGWAGAFMTIRNFLAIPVENDGSTQGSVISDAEIERLYFESPAKGLKQYVTHAPLLREVGAENRKNQQKPSAPSAAPAGEPNEEVNF